MSRQFFTAVLTALALSTSWVAAAATDVNQASVAELEAIKGIGPALSGKISGARQQAPFKDWADLVDRVSGLGPSHARRFSEAGLTVAGKTYAVPAGAKAADATAARDKRRDTSAAKDMSAKKAEPRGSKRDRSGSQPSPSPAGAGQPAARGSSAVDWLSAAAAAGLL